MLNCELKTVLAFCQIPKEVKPGDDRRLDYIGVNFKTGVLYASDGRVLIKLRDDRLANPGGPAWVCIPAEAVAKALKLTTSKTDISVTPDHVGDIPYTSVSEKSISESDMQRVLRQSPKVEPDSFGVVGLIPSKSMRNIEDICTVFDVDMTVHAQGSITKGVRFGFSGAVQYQDMTAIVMPMTQKGARWANRPLEKAAPWF